MKFTRDIRAEEDIHRAGDHLIRAVAMDGEVRLSAVDVTETARSAQKYHDLGPVAGVAIGRALGGAALLAQDIKSPRESLSLSFRGDGPLGGFTVIAESGLRLRASVVNPHCELPEEDVRGGGFPDLGSALGEGLLSVVRDFGQTEPYIGQIPIQTGGIAEDLTVYLNHSEQRRAAVGLAANISLEGMGRTGGFLVEPMPGVSSSTLDYLEARLAGFPGLDFFLAEGFTAAEILDLLIGNKPLRYLERQAISYRCNCRRERMERHLLTLGRKQLEELAEDPQGIRLECHFCDRKYEFSRLELLQLLNAAEADGRRD